MADTLVAVLKRTLDMERRKTTLRMVEAERRLAELEAQIEELKR